MRCQYIIYGENEKDKKFKNKNPERSGFLFLVRYRIELCVFDLSIEGIENVFAFLLSKRVDIIKPL